MAATSAPKLIRVEYEKRTKSFDKWNIVEPGFTGGFYTPHSDPAPQPGDILHLQVAPGPNGHGK
jgi:hypothetical protein